mmetsp:Transcript_71005/g.184358  ORF Transcript_71005/g.184358 Transcript_71005/m.184358 type:complete len:339 (+) Transcript_71005:480-1496(+)
MLETRSARDLWPETWAVFVSLASFVARDLVSAIALACLSAFSLMTVSKSSTRCFTLLCQASCWSFSWTIKSLMVPWCFSRDAFSSLIRPCNCSAFLLTAANSATCLSEASPRLRSKSSIRSIMAGCCEPMDFKDSRSRACFPESDWCRSCATLSDSRSLACFSIDPSTIRSIDDIRSFNRALWDSNVVLLLARSPCAFFKSPTIAPLRSHSAKRPCKWSIFTCAASIVLECLSAVSPSVLSMKSTRSFKELCRNSQEALSEDKLPCALFKSLREFVCVSQADNRPCSWAIPEWAAATSAPCFSKESPIAFSSASKRSSTAGWRTLPVLKTSTSFPSLE